MTAIKWAGKSRDKIEGLLAPFGGPEFLAGKDLDGEYFTANTDFALAWFGDYERPLLYHHGLDSEIKTSVVGRIAVKMTDAGLWMQAQLDKANEYYDAIASLVDKKALGLSSGSVSHLVEVDHKSGEIKAWPLIEGSLTPTPANPDAKAAYSVKATEAVAHLAVIGTEPPAELTDDDEDEDDEAAAKALAVPPTDEKNGTQPLRTFKLIQPTASPITGQVFINGVQTFNVVSVALKTGVANELTTVTVEFVPESVELDLIEPDIVDSTKSAPPQALHDAAVASGATCEPMGEMEAKSEPAPLLAVAGKSVETEPAIDLDALQARLSAKAVAVAKELLG